MKKEPISKQLYDIYGLYPAPGDRHVGELFSVLHERRSSYGTGL